MMVMKGNSVLFLAPSVLVKNSQHASKVVAVSALVATWRGLIVSQNVISALQRSLDDDTIASTVYYDNNYKGTVDDAAAELNKHNEQQFTKAAEKRSNHQQQQPSTQNNNNDYLVSLLQSIS